MCGVVLTVSRKRCGDVVAQWLTRAMMRKLGRSVQLQPGAY